MVAPQQRSFRGVSERRARGGKLAVYLEDGHSVRKYVTLDGKLR